MSNEKNTCFGVPAPERPPSDLERNLWEAFNKIKGQGGDPRAACIYLAGLYSGKDDGASNLFISISALGITEF